MNHKNDITQHIIKEYSIVMNFRYVWASWKKDCKCEVALYFMVDVQMNWNHRILIRVVG